METFSQSEENYLKAICRLEIDLNESVINTNLIAESLETKASSVTDMLKKLALKKLVNHQKYKGVSLTKKGRSVALYIVRKHRLWECFLVEKLKFKWDEVHDIAEQLEHINSEDLVSRLDSFLDFPKHDPHGDPIPDENGNISLHNNLMLSTFELKKNCKVVGVKDSSNSFLKYLEKNDIKLGSIIKIIGKEDYDNSLTIEINKKEKNISHQIANNIFIIDINKETK